MRNSFRKSLRSSWMKAVITIYRGLPERLSAAGRRLKPFHKWMIGVAFGVLLLGGLSLLARERSSKKEAMPTSNTTSAAKTETSGTKAENKHAAAAANAAPTPAETTDAEKEPAPAKKAEPAEASALPPGQIAFQKAPSTKAEEEAADEHEEDNVRARAQWFHDQRAYPNKYIPAGAFQKALEQRDAMVKQQKLRNAGQLNPQALITFPGDGLWHLMGPQPTNRPFGNFTGAGNSGFPTTSGRVTAVAVDPSDATGNTVYIGGAAGGVWKTTDGGSTWIPLTDAQPSLAIGSIAIDPNNHLTIYVGTGEDDFNFDGFYGAGILKSTNGGNTWTQLGASIFAGAKGPSVGGAQVGSIAVQPGNSSVVLAAVDFFDGNDPNGGIYQSTDGGTTWHLPTTGGQGAAGVSVVFDPAGSATTTATVYAALGDIFSGATNNGIWKSTDSGAHWTKQTGTGANVLPTTNVGRINLGYAASTTGGGATIYAAIADSSTTSSNLLGLFKTTDAGANWIKLTGAPNFCTSQCFYDIAIGVDPRNALNIVLGGGAFTDNFTSLFESTNGGTTWTGTGTDDFSGPNSGTHPHVDTHAIVFTPSGTTLRLYVGNDGGMWRTDGPLPGGVSPTWVDLNAQLALTQFYPGISAGVGDEDSGFGGTQDNDTEAFTGALAWSSVQACGDGGFTAIDNQFPTTIYTTCAPGSGPGLVAKSVFNGGLVGGNPSFAPADTGINHERSLFIPPLAIDDSTFGPNLYYGTCRVWQSTNGAVSWQAITGDLPSGTNTLGAACSGAGSITSFDIAHQSTSIVVAGTSNGKIWETTSAAAGAGSFWTEIDNLVPGQLPVRHVTSVRTERSDSTGQIVFATFSGFGSCGGCDGKGHIFATTNGGTNWSDISGDLPDAPINDLIVFHQGSPTFDALYIATDVGVFACENPTALTPCQNWTVIGDGLPNSPVLSLAVRRSSRILRAGTHGRSMWQIQLRDVQPPPLASISSLTPAAVMVGDPTTVVTVTGLNFSANTQVLFDGAPVATPTFLSTTQLTVSVNSSFFQDGHVFQVSVSDSQGADNGTLPFTVMNPIPNVTGFTVMPNPALDFAAVTLQFTGSNFVASTTVTFNNLPILGGTPSAGGTVFTVTVPAFDNNTAGSIPISLFNPLPGGGSAGSANITITANPGPVPQFNPSSISFAVPSLGASQSITTLQITNLTGAALNITNATITGTNAANFQFVAPTLAPSCNFETTHMQAAPNSCFFGMKYTAGTPPGMAQSVATLNVTDNATGSPQAIPISGIILPSLVGLSPVNFGPVVVGATSPTMNVTLLNLQNVTLNVTAAGFTIGGGTNPADFHLVAPVIPDPGGNPACGPAPFSVAAGKSCVVGASFTPSLPAGNETAMISVPDDGPGSPQSTLLLGTGIEITSISPSVVATGGPAFSLTVNGGGFAPSAVVNVGPNGTNPRLTTFVSANQLLASIPASDITTAGSLPISVTTPVPGGTTSEPKSLIIAQAPSATNDNVNFATDTSAIPFRATQDTTHATAQLTAFTGSPATPIDPTPCASGSTAKSVWFQFKAPAAGRVVADTRFSSYTANLSAWTISAPLPSSTATFSPVACNTVNVPASGPQPAEFLLDFAVTSGTTYYFMVTDPAGAGGTLTFSLDFASAAPINDDFNNAINTSAAPFSNTVNSIGATTDTGGRADPTPSCSPAGAANSGKDNTIWYKYAAAANGTVTVDTLTSPYETTLTVVTGSPGAFTQVTCNAGAGAGIAQSQASFAVTSGTTYFIMVSSVLGDGGTTNFHLTFAPGGVGALAKLAFTAQPSNVSAGASIAPPVQVTIEDASGNPVTTATNSVTIAIVANPSGGTLSGTMTAAAVNGVATFSNLSIDKVGTGYTLGASATALTSATSSPFNVTAGAATKLAFTTQPGNVAAGASITPAVQVTVQDAAGNTVTTATASITIAIGTNPSGGTLGGTATVSAVAGVATFSNLSINKVGNGYTLTANGGGLTQATSTAFNVTPGAATKLAFTVQPSNVGAGASISPAVQVSVEDAQGNMVTSATTSITIAIGTNPSAGTLGGTTTISAVSGVATFSNLSINNAGTGYTLTANGGALSAATSAAFNVTVGTASKLAFTVQPTNVAAGAAITPSVQVSVEDSQGNLVTTATTSITVAIGTNPGGGSLSGTATVSAVAGVATFPGLSISTAGTGYTLTANGGGLLQATSSLFNVSPAANPIPTLTGISPTNGILNQPVTLVLTGTNFIAASIVNFGAFNDTGGAVTNGGNTLTISIPGAQLAAAGNINVTVTNAAPGGGTTAAQVFQILNPVPTITSLSPPSAIAGGPQFTLTVNGTNFINGAVVDFNGSNVTTAFVSSTQITATIPASALVSPGTALVSVQNPAPTTGSSPTANFFINNPVPTATSLSPTSTTAGGPTFTLTVNGTNFIHTSSVLFNGSAQSTTFVSATQLTASILSGEIVTAGPATVAVNNPTPGGGTSGNLAFTINAPTPASIVAAAGTPQNAQVNTAFAALLQAIVKDGGGNPIPNLAVTFTAPASGASGTFTGGVKTVNVNTNASGVASAPVFTANATVGSYNVTASVTGLATQANFTLTNTPGAAASMTANAGTTPQSAGINTAFANALAVTVTDAASNPVSGVNVTFTAPASGASGKFSNSTATISVATNSSGVASAPFTANATAGGPYTVAATATGLPTVNFSLTNTAGTMTANAGTTPQSATVNTAFANALAVTVKDASSNPVSGVNVTFTAPGSGASGKFSNSTTTITVATNASGVASAPFTANATAGGPYTVTAAATGLPAVNFSLTNTAGAASLMTGNAGTTMQSAAINTAFANALAVTVTDASSNPIFGVSVTFTAPGSGASGKFSNSTATITVSTNASGVASAPFTANGAAGGPYTVTATATGLPIVDFSLTNTAGAALSMTANAGTTPQSAAISSAFANPLAVTVTDAGSNPVSGVNVTFTAPGSGASGKFSNSTATITVSTNASGVASAPFTANTTAGGPYTVTATATGLPTVNFSLTNSAGPVAKISATSGTPQSAAISMAFAAPLVATVTDAGNNPVSGVVVTFTVNPAVSGASATFAVANTATTNAQGIATSNTLTANGITGAYTVVASVSGIAGTATFNLTNLAGAPATITATSGTPQTVLVNAAFATLKVLVKDSGGNPVSSATVTFTAPANGASGIFAGATNVGSATTDATGTASAPAFTANFTNGAYVVNAAVAGVAAPAPFSLTNNANTPTLTSLAPTSATAGGLTFALTVNGTNFTTTSVVSFNGVAKTTTFVNGTQLTAAITAADIATAATVNVSVTTPTPGGGTSGNLPFAINNPAPTITSLAPTSATTGSVGFPLTVNGTNFVAASTVSFNGAAKTTAFVSATQLTATILATDIANAGIVPITVTNPAPGGGTSTPAAQFIINNTQPTGVSLSPSSTLAGTSAFTLTVNGNGFLTGATITFNNTQKTTTFVNSTQLTAPITSADVAKAGTFNVSVTNPAPVTGPVVVLTFTVNNPVPTITTLGQTHIAGGTAFTLTVNGTNFNSSSVVNFGTKAEPTTLVSATQVTAAIPATDVATAGPVTVTVTNPAPGGGPTPTSATFTVDGYALAGPGAAVTVTAGQTATIPITITPTANGFANPVVFSVTGLPKDAALMPLTVTPGNAKSTVSLMITTVARGSAPPSSPMDQPLPPMVRFLLVSWTAALLAGIYVAFLIRRTPRLRRYAVLVPLVLLLISGGVLAGCSTMMKGTPPGTSPLTVTATSGTLSQSTPATLTVQ